MLPQFGPLEPAAADTPGIGTKRAADGEKSPPALQHIVEGSLPARAASPGPLRGNSCGRLGGGGEGPGSNPRPRTPTSFSESALQCRRARLLPTACMGPFVKYRREYSLPLPHSIAKRLRCAPTVSQLPLECPLRRRQPRRARGSLAERATLYRSGNPRQPVDQSGTCSWGRKRLTTLYSVGPSRDPNHDAVMRIGGRFREAAPI